MTKIDSFIEKLQKQPYETRVKIMWGTVGVVALVLFLVWVISLKSTIKNINTKDLIKSPVSSAGQTAISLASIERIEASDKNLKIYFNFNNTTNDILNISPMTNITLTINDQQITPTQITDRQGQPFAQKILSFTQNFGTLVFPKVDGDRGTLVFSQMFFEQNPSQMLSQTIQLDMKKLEMDSDLRN